MTGRAAAVPVLIIGLIISVQAQAQRLHFSGSSATSPAALASEMAQLSHAAIPEWKDPDRTKYLDSLFRLQMAAGEYREAANSIDSLLRLLPASSERAGRLMPFQLAALAKASQIENKTRFEDVFRQAFREKVKQLDDLSSVRFLHWFAVNADAARNDFRASLDQQSDKTELSLDDAINLVRQYVSASVFEEIQPLTSELISEDDHRRYSIQDDISVKTKDGATISVIVVRPKGPPGPLPTAFTFTIYASSLIPDNPKRAAAHGYAGVVAFTRGKRLSPDEPVPYEHDGDDAREVIEWIAKQPWSDGKVGMLGGSYDGFTQWAAAKKAPPALRTIVPYVAAIPGQGLPMENNVFMNANYGWAFYVTDNKYLDEKVYSDPQRWFSLNQKWYASGAPYRDIDKIDGTPNKWLQRWLSHPAFDGYWQGMVPWKQDFSKINIPVLTITGYYDDGQISAMEYLRQHYQYGRNPDHYLLIGPWDHPGSQAAEKPMNLRGYALDPVAQVDTPEITFQWLDYVLRGGKKPQLLEDKINYELMGSNTWKHAPSLEAMHNTVTTLYLSNEKDRQYYRLTTKKPGKASFLEQSVDFTDRKSQTDDYYPAPIVGKQLDLSSGFAFISEPFESPVSVSGSLAGVLKAQINKKDMDVGVVLYEVQPNGELFELTYFLGRASFAKDMSARHLLTPGRTESIRFDRSRLVSRQLSKGSRLLVVVDVNKNAFSQVNYGTGKDVSDESISDATSPLRVRWSTDSYVQIPLWK